MCFYVYCKHIIREHNNNDNSNNNDNKGIVFHIALSYFIFKSALSGLRQFWASESPLKMMKNNFYFTLKAVVVLKRFKFLVMYKNGLIRKTRLIKKKYDVTSRLTNNYNTHIAQHLKK